MLFRQRLRVEVQPILTHACVLWVMWVKEREEEKVKGESMAKLLTTLTVAFL